VCGTPLALFYKTTELKLSVCEVQRFPLLFRSPTDYKAKKE